MVVEHDNINDGAFDNCEDVEDRQFLLFATVSSAQGETPRTPPQTMTG